ncbi:MAG: hypothetical protein NC218_06820 [Acetobacter sp.]|nr:hypothetical protein [Acetobacter sp.]
MIFNERAMWFMDCHALVPYGGARNDGERCGAGDPLTRAAELAAREG